MDPLLISILALGLLSIGTDVSSKKIKNSHLAVICMLAGVYYGVLFIVGRATFAPLFFLNLALSFVLGLVFYRFSLWKAGDAKLFFVYALLLPENRYFPTIPFPCVVLLFNSFIIGLLFILPAFLVDILRKKDEVIKKFVSGKTLFYFARVYFISLCITWLIMPLLSFLPLRIKSDFFVNFLLLYSAYFTVSKLMGRVKNKYSLSLVLALGLVFRFLLLPESLSLGRFMQVLKVIAGYSVILYLLEILKSQGDPRVTARISFAPFLFLGAVLSHSDFLWMVMKATTYLNR